MISRSGRNSEHLLVDGYNLIKADPILRDHEKVSLKAARQALEGALRRYFRRTGARIQIFYDGDQDPDVGPRESAAGDGVEIAFSRSPQKADDLIKHAVQARHGARYLRVISSDREIRRFAGRHKVASTPAPLFAEELECPPAQSSADPVMPPPELDPDLSLAPDEVASWEKLFRARRDRDPDESG